MPLTCTDDIFGKRKVTADAVSVAAPILGPDSAVVAAVSLVVRTDSALPTALAPLVQAAARGITRSLKPRSMR